MGKFSLPAGVYTAIVTPFTEDGKEVDYDALDKLLTSLIEGGCAGVVPVGTTGESPTLSAEEKTKIFEFVVKKCKGKLKIIAGTGSNNTAGTIKATEEAKKLGVDACLIVNPYYSKPSQEGLFQHIKAVDQVGLPIMLYNIPGRTGIALTAATVARCYSECPNVFSIKEATGSLDMASEIKSLCDIQLFSGDDSLTLPLISVGGSGVVSVLSNLAPEKVVSMVKNGLEGNMTKATSEHLELFKVFKTMFIETNPVPCKYAMSLNGLCHPSVRLPLAPLAESSAETLTNVLVEKGLVSEENAKKRQKN